MAQSRNQAIHWVCSRSMTDCEQLKENRWPKNYSFRGSVNAAVTPAFPTLRPRVCACVRVQWLLLSAAAASLFKFTQPSLSASCTGVREVEPNTKAAGLVCFAPARARACVLTLSLTRKRASIPPNMSAEMRRCSTNAVRERKAD